MCILFFCLELIGRRLAFYDFYIKLAHARAVEFAKINALPGAEYYFALVYY